MPPAKSTKRISKKVSGIDTICWMEPSEHTKSGYEHHSADRGEIVELPEADVERLAAYLIDPDEEIPAEQLAAGWIPASDATLEGATVEELIAYLGQVPEDDHDEELTRVLSIELDRPEDEQRVTVLELDPDYVPPES